MNEQRVRCPLPGLEQVAVTYNLMATARQLATFRENLTAETAKPVIRSIDGWPDGGDPFGDDAPMAFRFWVGYRGWQTAVLQFVTDPNYSTA